MEFVAMDIFGTLLKMSNSKQLVLVMTNRYSKLPRVVLTSKTAAAHNALGFKDNWIIPFQIPNNVLMDPEHGLLVSFQFTLHCFLQKPRENGVSPHDD